MNKWVPRFACLTLAIAFITGLVAAAKPDPALSDVFHLMMVMGISLVVTAFIVEAYEETQRARIHPPPSEEEIRRMLRGLIRWIELELEQAGIELEPLELEPERRGEP